jgi:hypothetical protein
MQTEAADPLLAGYDDANDLMAATLNWVFLNDGEQALRDVLETMLVHPTAEFLAKAKATLTLQDYEVESMAKGTSRESLEKTAAELEAMGLSQVAGIVVEVAETLPRKADVCTSKGPYWSGGKMFPDRDCRCRKCRPPKE